MTRTVGIVKFLGQPISSSGHKKLHGIKTRNTKYNTTSTRFIRKLHALRQLESFPF